MDRIPLVSSILAWVQYFPNSSVLQVGLRTGRDYDYFDVPLDTYQDLLASESKGRFYNAHIRNDFRYQLIRSSGAQVEN